MPVLEKVPPTGAADAGKCKCNSDLLIVFISATEQLLVQLNILSLLNMFSCVLYVISSYLTRKVCFESLQNYLNVSFQIQST